MYILMDKTILVLKTAWPNGVSPTGKLAEVLHECVEGKGESDEVEKAFEGKGDLERSRW